MKIESFEFNLFGEKTYIVWMKQLEKVLLSTLACQTILKMTN